jgi:diguanylate cyclase
VSPFFGQLRHGAGLVLASKLAAADRAEDKQPIMSRAIADPTVHAAVERRQAARIQALRLPAVFYVIEGLVLTTFGALGIISLQVGAAYTAAGLLVATLVYVVVRRGWNLYLQDSNFTLLHIIAATAIEMCFLWLFPEVGFVFVLCLFIIGAFGSMDLSARQFALWCALTGMTAVGIMLSEAGTRFGIPTGTIAERMLVAFCIVYTLARFAVLVTRMSGLRIALHERNRALKASVARIEELANIDELTGVWNRRAMMRLIEEELERCNRDDLASFCLLSIDLDHFKSVNDTLGHPVGDSTLHDAAAIIQGSMRSVDRLGRFGGEEFIALLTGASSEVGRLVAERIRHAVECHHWRELGDGRKLTLSAGMTAYRRGDSVRSLLERADAALYEAKRAGRNRVEVAPECAGGIVTPS